MDLPVRGRVGGAGSGPADAGPAAPGLRCRAAAGATWHLALLNQAPTSAYFAQTLQIWEQGRGSSAFTAWASGWGWLWPYATLIYVVFRVSRKEGSS